MYITGLGTAVPPDCYGQEACWQALQQAAQFAGLSPRSQRLLQKVSSGRNGIATRHLAVADLREAFITDPDRLHARFAEHAPSLAASAGQQALAAAGLPPSAVQAVIVSTCTGYLCPGLTSYVSERLGLPVGVQAYDLVGQGCGAALPNLTLGEALIAAGRAHQVLAICVEVCSAAAYLDDDPGVLISACLFGDGAAAAVLSSAPQAGARKVAWVGARSRLVPAARQELRLEQRHGLLRNILTPAVPALAAEHAHAVLTELLADQGLQPADIAGWVLHAGGRDVLAALRERLRLAPDDLELSAAVLRELGNVSSPFVLFVLARALAAARPGGWWWLSSFGAGFSCHGALLRVE